MYRAEIEGDAIAIYRMAGLEPDEPASLTGLVRRLLGTPVKAVSAMRGPAHLVTVEGESRIYVRRGIPLARMRFDIGHELAHWWFRRCGVFSENIESMCDALGAALVAPMPLYRSVRKRIPTPIRAARALQSTESLAVLREGEVLGTPVALVQPHRILARGEPWAWPEEPELRRIGKTGHPALRRVNIKDEPARVALIAA